MKTSVKCNISSAGQHVANVMIHAVTHTVPDGVEKHVDRSLCLNGL